MLTLVMPNAQVVAGINVQQAMTTPFGLYLLSLIAPQNQQIQSLATMIGFNPMTDVTELLVAYTGAPAHAGVALARGTFDPAKIVAAATLAGATTETYGGLTILEPKPAPAAATATTATTPQPTPGLAFLDSTLAVVGDVASVKAAIDRRTAPSVLPSALLTQVNQWSTTQDAWVVDTAPLSSLNLPAGAPKLPGGAQMFQAVQQAAGGVKFGANVVVTTQAQTDTAQNATALAGILQFVANLAQTQATQDPQATALLKSLTVTATGNAMNLTLSLPQAQIEQLVPRAGATQSQHRAVRKM